MSSSWLVQVRPCSNCSLRGAVLSRYRAVLTSPSEICCSKSHCSGHALQLLVLGRTESEKQSSAQELLLTLQQKCPYIHRS